jgi:DNA segregation ATPase FtsK/SpoIIIE-like protein
MNNLLVVGKTGSGRTNFLNRYLADLYASYKEASFRVIVIDPRANIYQNLVDSPNLLFGRLTTLSAVKIALDWVNAEIETRLIVKQPRLPVMIVIEELADLIIDNQDYIEQLISKITLNSQQTDIYLVAGSVKVTENNLSLAILNSFNFRLVFGLSNYQESFYVLEEAGAEELFLPGDCILKDVGRGRSYRYHVPCIG